MNGMITTRLRNLLTAVVCLLTVSTAQAQFTGTVNQVPRDDWAPEAATFNAAEVGQALGTDAATLLAALQTWMDTADANPNMFFYAAPSAPDTWTDAYTTGDEKGFWLDENGEIIAFPNGAFYANPVWDTDASTFSINIGMMPGMLEYGVYNRKLNFALQYGGKTATFEIDFTVTGGEQIELPEIATLKESELNIVGEKSVTVQQYPRTTYDADRYYIILDDVVEKLGLSSGNILKGAMEQMLYTTEFDLETVGKKDSLTNRFTADAPGFWYTDIRVDGQATGECSSTTHSGGCYFYIDILDYTVENDSLSFSLGQYPSKCQGEEKLFANMYLLYGDKAYKLNFNFEVLVREQGNGLEGLNKMGEGSVSMELEVANDYVSKPLTIDYDAIAAVLGCDPSILNVRALDAFDEFGASTANNGGFWFNKEGRVVAWASGEAAIFVEPSTQDDFSYVSVGQYPNYLVPGEPAVAVLYFFDGPEGENYYTYTITVNPIEPKTVEGEFTNEQTISFTIQTKPDNSVYPIDETWSINLSTLEDILGSSDVTLFGLATDENAESSGSIYSNAYSCDPKPGFWLNSAGRVSVWADSDAKVGISYANGTFQFFQYPGRNNLGEVFQTQLFLVNLDNNKMITFNINVAFVDDIVKADVVGEENLTLPVSAQGETVQLDMAKAAEALGVDTDFLLESDCLRGMTISGMYGGYTSCFDGLAFDKNGNTIQGSGDEVAVQIEIFDDGDDVFLFSSSTDEVAEDFHLYTQFCFQVENKQYIYHTTFVSKGVFEGIKDIATSSKQSGKVFDLSGRQVMQPQRGLYIKDGKKLIVK